MKRPKMGGRPLYTVPKKKRKTKEPVANFSDISIQAQFDEAFQNLQDSFIEDLIEFQQNWEKNSNC